MSAAHAPARARLEELRLRFDQVALAHSSLNAVVVFRPDLFREEAERQAQDRYGKAAEPGWDSNTQDLADESIGPYDAARHAADWERWIPPESGSIEQIGGERYWAHVIRAYDWPGSHEVQPDTEIWR